jgi:hypothetical protein
LRLIASMINTSHNESPFVFGTAVRWHPND